MLSDFSKHTRQSDSEHADKTLLAKKYLAVHSTLAPMPLVYAQIASDFPLLELRTHEPNIHAYPKHRAFDPDTFVTIMRDGYAHLKGPIDTKDKPCLSYFIDTLFPRPVGQEEWMDWHHDEDTWKQRAYFVAMNCANKAEFFGLVKKVAETPARGAGGSFGPNVDANSARGAGGIGGDEISDLHTRIQRIRADKHLPTCTAQELGSIINELVMPNDVDYSKIAAAPQKTASIEATATEEFVGGNLILTEKKICLVGSESPPPLAAAIQALQDYRKRALLNVTFPPARVAKQLIFAAMKFEGTELPHFEKLRGKDQEKFAAFDPAKDTDTLKACLANLSGEKIAAALNRQANEEAVKCVPVQTNDAREFLGAVVGMYASQSPAPQGPGFVREIKAYLKRFPKPAEAFIQAILEA